MVPETLDNPDEIFHIIIRRHVYFNAESYGGVSMHIFQLLVVPRRVMVKYPCNLVFMNDSEWFPSLVQSILWGQ